MATNLAGDDCIGLYDACYLRVGRLSATTCAPQYGQNNGIISGGLITHTSSPVLDEPEEIAPKTGCGRVAFTIQKQSKVKSRTITGSMIFWDYELFEIMFGGTVVLGAVGQNGAGKVIGWQEPDYNAVDRAPCSFEVISRVAGEGQGACGSPASDRPLWTGVIYPKCFFNVGDVEWGEGEHVVNFTGTAQSNPNYGSGPFRDFDNVAVAPVRNDTCMVLVGYDSESEFLNGEAAARCGYQTTPAAS